LFSSAFLTGTILEFAAQGSIKGFTGCLFSFFNSLTLSEYRKVLRVCSQHPLEGEIFATITVLHLDPVKESLRT